MLEYDQAARIRNRPIDAEHFDQYAALSHKANLNNDIGEVIAVQNWLPKDHIRRITAYRILFMYLTNTARNVLNVEDEQDRHDHREYGEPGLLCRRVASGVLGQGGITFELPDYTAATSPPPRLDDAPTEPDADATSLEARYYQAAYAAWETEKSEQLDAYLAAREQIESLRAWNTWLKEFIEKDGIAGKILLAERNHIIPLGDGVFVVENQGHRPTVTVYEPDSFIADYETGKDFPNVIHLMWETSETVDSEHVSTIRRITFEMVPISDDPNIEATRTFAYQTEPSELHCVKTDVTFDRDKVLDHYRDKSGRGRHVDATQWETRLGTITTLDDGTPLDRYPLNIDFLPVVHIPNHETGSGWGDSLFTGLIQLFDDIATNDVAFIDALDIAANPHVFVSGTNVPDTMHLEAGTITGLGEGASVTTIDTTHAARVVLDSQNAMLARLAINAQVPETVQGRIPTSDFPSGRAIAYANKPFDDLIATLQIPRGPKYALLIRMVMRLALQAGQGPTDATTIPTVTTVFGGYEPQDPSTTAADGALLATSGAASRLAIAEMLNSGGIPVGEPTDEVRRLEAQDTTGAKEIFDATGSDQLAAAYLGLDVPETQTAALPLAITLDTTGGTDTPADTTDDA